MLKSLPAIFFVILFTITAKAQLPLLTQKATAYDIEHSPFYKEFAGKYDLVIAHHHIGGWSNQEYYYTILAFKDNERYKIVFTREKDFGKGLPEAKIKKEFINKRTADSILSVFNSNNFWALNNDTLAITKGDKYYDVDAHRYRYQEFYTSDGFSDIFEIITRDGYQNIYSYEPEYYFKNLPQIKQRGRFINAKRAFLSVFPNVWQPPVK